eukprot:SAG11_NODE_2711_length_3056_cov_1.984782_2_plen_203_part_00
MERAEADRKARALALEAELEEAAANKDYERAVQCFAEALRIDPDNKEVEAKKAKAWELKVEADEMMEERRLRGCSQDIRHCGRPEPRRRTSPSSDQKGRRPNESSSATGEGRARVHAGDFDAAVKTFEDVLVPDPYNQDIEAERDEAARKALKLKLKGEQQMKDGNAKGAVTTFLEALKIDPDNQVFVEEEVAAERRPRRLS